MRSIISGRPRWTRVEHSDPHPPATSSCCFTCCLSLLAGCRVDWSFVVVGVGAALGEGDHMVYLISFGLSAVMTEPAVEAEDPLCIALLGPR